MLMAHLVLRYSPTAGTAPCPLCAQPLSCPPGLQLVIVESALPVCSGCGRQDAPHLAALLGLAEEARRVGRIGRHTVVPPYAALLDLARAADTFSSQFPNVGRDA